jgi:hypothetical protein
MPDFRIRIDIKNVTRGDIVELCNELLSEHGENFDAQRGEFVIHTSTREGQSGENYFPFDWTEDED